MVPRAGPGLRVTCRSCIRDHSGEGEPTSRARQVRWSTQAPKGDSCWKQRVNSLGQLVGRTLSQVSTTYNLCSKILHQRSKSDAGSLCSVASASGPGASLRITGKSVDFYLERPRSHSPFCTQLQELPGPLTWATCPQSQTGDLQGHLAAVGCQAGEPVTFPQDTEADSQATGNWSGLYQAWPWKRPLPGVLGGGGRSQTPSIFLAVMGTLPSCPKRGSPRTSPVISGFVST